MNSLKWVLIVSAGLGSALVIGCSGSVSDADAPETGDGDGAMPGDGDGTAPGDGDGTAPGDGDGTQPGDGDGTASGDGDGTDPGDGDGNAPKETVDYSCEVAEDCSIENVQNCCGYYPRCVNKDSPLPPPDCEGQGGVCGFPDITHCECVDNTCRSMQDDQEV